MGWHVVNMTGYPEAVLAAELGIRYAGGRAGHRLRRRRRRPRAGTMEAVLAVMRGNVASVRQVITEAITPRLRRPHRPADDADAAS